MMLPLQCYLLREDGQWYVIGNFPRWSHAFATFPGPVNGSVCLTTEHLPTLALRLEDYGHTPRQCLTIAEDMIRWADGQSIRFLTELDPEVPANTPPAPITGALIAP